jgi:pyridoxamine 5'-phosphate oxidase
VNLADIRRDYAHKELSPEDCLPDPVEQFKVWMAEAIEAGVAEPTAMHLATVGPDARPSARMVLLKGVEGGRFVFYTNYLSRKGRQLEANPFVALTFFWAELERQVRIEGSASRVPAETSDLYFATRPYTSRIGAWASEQSTEIASKAVLVRRAAEFGLKYALGVPRPPHWGGYGVVPERLEFWQGRPSRLHDRVGYQLEAGVWRRARLAP